MHRWPIWPTAKWWNSRDRDRNWERELHCSCIKGLLSLCVSVFPCVYFSMCVCAWPKCALPASGRLWLSVRFVAELCLRSVDAADYAPSTWLWWWHKHCGCAIHSSCLPAAQKPKKTLESVTRKISCKILFKETKSNSTQLSKLIVLLYTLRIRNVLTCWTRGRLVAILIMFFFALL